MGAARSAGRAVIWLGCLVAMAGSQRSQITFEILPDAADVEAPAPIEVYRGLTRGKIEGAQNDTAGHLRAMGDSMYDMKVLHEQPAVDITSGSGMKFAAGADLELTAGAKLTARFGENVDLLSGGGLQFQTTGAVSAMTGADVEMINAGGMYAMVSGSADLAAGSLQGYLNEGLEMEAGGAVSLTAANGAAVTGGGAGTAFFSGVANAAARSASVTAADALRLSAQSVLVQAQDGLNMATPGSMLSASGTSELKFVAYAWRSSASFDQFENVFPVMTGVSEILINSAAGGALVMSESLATVGLSVATGGSGGLAWAEVWKMSVGSGVYSMAGQRIQLSEKQDVEGVRLTSSVGGSAHSGSGVFEGWSEVVFHFGVATSAGAVKVASGTIELGAGTSASVSSESVSISAAAEIAISAGEVEFASEVISVQASAGAAIEADRLSLVSAGALDVVSSAGANAELAEFSVAVGGDVELLANAVAAAAGSADLMAT